MSNSASHSPANSNPAARGRDALEEWFLQGRAKAEGMVEDAITYTRQNPARAVLTALAAGYVLKILPASRIIGGLLRAATPLVKPAAFIYGAYRLATQREPGSANAGKK